MVRKHEFILLILSLEKGTKMIRKTRLDTRQDSVSATNFKRNEEGENSKEKREKRKGIIEGRKQARHKERHKRKEYEWKRIEKKKRLEREVDTGTENQRGIFPLWLFRASRFLSRAILFYNPFLNQSIHWPINGLNPKPRPDRTTPQFALLSSPKGLSWRRQGGKGGGFD